MDIEPSGLVFVDIDTQRDFLDPRGALAVPGAAAILPHLARLTDWARAHAIPVLATACAHAPDEREDDFPPHCVLGTPGQERVEPTAWPGSLVLGPDDRLSGDLPPHLTLQKRRYDLFSHPDADRIVTLYARTNPWFVVYGVATDYCVRAAVLGLLRRGHRVLVVADAVRAVDPDTEPALLTEWAHQGAVLTLTDVVGGLVAGS